jgi:transcriptional regulator with PAS, ATPase and Fis domain
MDLLKSIIGNDPQLKQLLKDVLKVAPTNANVLILGETGTGKELIAQALHQNSLRCTNPFLCLNCAAISKGLAESELFGAVKGAFTGADADKKGYFDAVDGGTLFLDEVNSLDMEIQPKLLRFMESGEYFAVGSVKKKFADVRIIGASNANLEKQVKQGLFREDLFYRLSIIPLEVPPLRERTEDIELLLKYYLSFYAKKYCIKTPLLTKQVLSKL